MPRRKEVLTIHEVRQRIEWSMDRANTIYIHVANNSNMLDSKDIESLKIVIHYLQEAMSAKWTNQIL